MSSLKSFLGALVPEVFRISIMGFVLRSEGFELTGQDRAVLNEYVSEYLVLPENKARRRNIVGMVGLVGSGKSKFARLLAPTMGAVVIDNNEIRAILRRSNIDFARANVIAVHAARHALGKNYSVIFDSDHIDADKRALAMALGRNLRVKVSFIRVLTQLQIIIGRIKKADLSKDEFYQGAKSDWTGDPEITPNIIKQDECLRRLSHHYRWSEWAAPGGIWQLRKLSFPVVMTVNNNPWNIGSESVASYVAGTDLNS